MTVEKNQWKFLYNSAILILLRDVAQLGVERLLREQEAAGSNPVIPTIYYIISIVISGTFIRTRFQILENGTSRQLSITGWNR
jgi:hypothetical protein